MSINIEPQSKVTEVELIYRGKTKVSERPKITCSREAHNLFQRSWDINRIELVEQFKILLLDRRNACIGIAEISTGGIAGCVADPKIIFATALKARASGIILAHNHPSGNLAPSQADIELTKKLVYAGNMLDLVVPDHLIETKEGYYSFSDQGMMPSPS
ncbi:JAB domain-containing protein [Chryseolinea sp. H1M3-3]|uniref:JAB domain-containing protein n=1 Tax=Chryseolinea sp. H1M3-3 TaxID=3034144 RepID=UPI0023EBA00E|nr:JAB domain-containing protein [Chryseolinea sp. H1M3-3]